MAVELNRFLQEQLTSLPEGHPDRAFIDGLHTVVSAYAQREPVEPAAPAVLYEATSTESGDTVPAEAAGVQVEAAPPTEQVRQRYYGRVAAKPDFQTLPRGGRRGHFPLATHPAADTTVYYDVYTWNKPGKPWTDRLEALRLTRGQAVEVTGYEHSGGIKQDGTPKPAQIYAGAPIKAR